MLKEAFELIQKIETGIKHKASINIFSSENGLAVEASIICKKDNRTYVFQWVVSRKEMITCDENQVIDDFIFQANKQFRIAYGESV